VDRHSRINPRQSRTRPHRPRKSQLIQRHTTSMLRLGNRSGCRTG
jgi:hypothetical protein